MKCKKCGKEIADGVQFCQYCGCPQETAKAHTGEAAEIRQAVQLAALSQGAAPGKNSRNGVG